MSGVTTLAEVELRAVRAVLARYGLELVVLGLGAEITGSYWGESEAGLVANQVYARPDTPLHSVFHEAAHAIVMGPERRAALVRDAGGDYAEEDAVCYLQILLADLVPGYGRSLMWADMDAWGYTFRLGSARAWFETDAAEAGLELCARGLCEQDAGRVRLRTIAERA